jgi:hypothetical protein
MTQLPAEGRKGTAPPWPLPHKRDDPVHALELTIWRELWRTPQAVIWQRLRFTRDVAAYARHKAQAELGDLDHAREARMLADRLGLTPLSMLRLRWEVAADEVAAKRDQRAVDAAPPPLHLAVDPDAASG